MLTPDAWADDVTVCEDVVHYAPLRVGGCCLFVVRSLRGRPTAAAHALPSRARILAALRKGCSDAMPLETGSCSPPPRRGPSEAIFRDVGDSPEKMQFLM